MAQTVCVWLSPSDRRRLEAIASDRNLPRKHVERAKIVLASADGRPVQRVATGMDVSRPMIGRWQQRFAEAGPDGLLRDKLNAVELAVPAGRVIEAIVVNYATHKHPKVKAWLARHPRWTFHFTPTSGSWLNAVETFFSALTRQRIRRGSFHSIGSLLAAINQYLDQRNAEPRPFVWTTSAASILAKLSRLPVAE